jgi:hypothetical protein
MTRADVIMAKIAAVHEKELEARKQYGKEILQSGGIGAAGGALVGAGAGFIHGNLSSQNFPRQLMPLYAVGGALAGAGVGGAIRAGMGKEKVKTGGFKETFVNAGLKAMEHPHAMTGVAGGIAGATGGAVAAGKGKRAKGALIGGAIGGALGAGGSKAIEYGVQKAVGF